MTQQKSPTDIFAINLAAIAREIAMDILPIDQIMKIHQLTDEEWVRVQSSQQFKKMLSSMIAEWESAMNTKERLKAKAQSGLEMNLESLVLAMADEQTPLAQRVEAAKFLARLGEVDGSSGNQGGGFMITLNIGTTTTTVDVTPKVIEGALSVD